MKAIIMAGGFAKRLGLEKKSKCLVEVGGKPIIDYTLEKLQEIPNLDRIFVITSDPFLPEFLEWARDKPGIKVLSDGGKSQETKVGALAALFDFLDKEEINDDIFWAGADNVFNFSLKNPAEIFKNENKDLAVFYDVKNKEDAKRFGVILSNENNIITNFEEKPSEPKSTIISSCMHFIKKDSLPLLKELKESKKDRDNMGIVIEYLHKKVPVYSYVAEEGNIDIGSKEALEKAEREVSKRGL